MRKEPATDTRTEGEREVRNGPGRGSREVPTQEDLVQLLGKASSVEKYNTGSPMLQCARSDTGGLAYLSLSVGMGKARSLCSAQIGWEEVVHNDRRSFCKKQT